MGLIFLKNASTFLMNVGRQSCFELDGFILDLKPKLTGKKHSMIIAVYDNMRPLKLGKQYDTV